MFFVMGTAVITNKQRKKKMQQRNHPGTVSRKTIGVGVGVNKLVLLDRNPVYYSNVGLYYKYVFGPSRVL